MTAPKTTERITAKDFLAMQTAGTGRKKQPAAKTEPAEKDIQATLVQALRQCGYEVMETGQDRSQLQGRMMDAIRPFLRGDIAEAFIFNLIGKVLRTWSNNDAGLPDLFITHPDWPSGEWLGIELKTPTGKVRPEQQRLADLGRVVIVRGVAEGLREVGCKESDLKLARRLAEGTTSERHSKLINLMGQFQEVK